MNKKQKGYYITEFNEWLNENKQQRCFINIIEDIARLISSKGRKQQEDFNLLMNELSSYQNNISITRETINDIMKDYNIKVTHRVNQKLKRLVENSNALIVNVTYFIKKYPEYKSYVTTYKYDYKMQETTKKTTELLFIKPLITF